MSNGSIVKTGRRITLWLHPGIIRALKGRALDESRPPSRVVETAVREYLKTEVKVRQ